jgi:hypothetical protein
MDEGTFFLQLLSSVNVIAVAFAITTTAILKYILFRSPDSGTNDPLLAPEWKVIAGRAIPLLPIFFATSYVLAQGYVEMRYGVVLAKLPGVKITGWAAIVGRGVVSGAMAGYLYRTWKVSILGQ